MMKNVAKSDYGIILEAVNAVF